MWPRFIVFLDPGIQIGLQLVDRTIHLLAEGDTLEFVEHGPVEALTGAVGLRALGFRARVIDVLDRKVELGIRAARDCHNTRSRDRSARAAA
jgi:hypothetical protein